MMEADSATDEREIDAMNVLAGDTLEAFEGILASQDAEDEARDPASAIHRAKIATDIARVNAEAAEAYAADVAARLAA